MSADAPAVTKMELIAHLAAKHGFTRYLELCTPATGRLYERLDRNVLTTAHRLIYNCPADFDDGLGIDFRTAGFDIGPCLAEIRARGARHDIILVDPYHDYACSRRDLEEMFVLLEAGGFLVVHDCLPAARWMATPQFNGGEWCGVTYKAYLDFVSARRLDYRTVDTDFGCGIIRKPASWYIGAALRRMLWPYRDRRLWQEWHAIGNDFDRAFSLLEAHKQALLRLVGPDAFLAS
jgi:hypothetical protein